MAKIQFKRSSSSQQTQSPPPKTVTPANTTSGQSAADTLKSPTKQDDSKADAKHNQTNKTISDKTTTGTTKAKTSGRFKFFPILSAFHSSSSSSPSSSTTPSTSASTSSSTTPTATQTPVASSSALNKQSSLQPSNDPKTGSSSTNQIKNKSKIKFSLTFRSDNKQANKTLTTTAPASLVATTTSTSAFKTNSATTTNSSSKTVLSTPLPPYEVDITKIDGAPYIECPLCVLLVSYEATPDLRTCAHRTCLECMQRYLKTEINHSRLNITCPICSEPLLQNVIKEILNDDKFYDKYESFMMRKVLAAEPDARWCPAPDCGYAVLANGCASCPRLMCERDGCNTAFCYHCKQEWHPNQTCIAASMQRNKRAGIVLNALNISDLIEESTQSGDVNAAEGRSGNRKSSKASQHNTTLRPEDIKECPVCSSRIIKMNDGSCNHMTCSICETEFCWLCMKEISDFHYFSPSGCTFWGKKPWSRKKKFLWRLGMLVGAPICIVFIAGISVPAIVIGIPFWAARKLHARLEKKHFSRYRKNAILTGGVLLSFLVSPIITAMTLAVGIPLLLGYVYGVVPLSLCRSSGGCLSASPSVDNLHEQFTQAAAAARRFNAQATDVVSIDLTTSHKIGNPSIGETSMYMSNISLETNSIGHVTNVERDDRESASNAALAGSIFSQNADDGNSTRALAGSIISKDSGGYTLIPVEVHNHNNSNSNNNNYQGSNQAASASSAATATSASPTMSSRTNQLQQQSSSDISTSEQVATAGS